jgi:hypothetical protein
VHCTAIDLGAPGTDAVTWSARVGRRRVGSGRVKPGALRRVTIALAGLADRDHVDVTLGGRPRVLAAYVDQFC